MDPDKIRGILESLQDGKTDVDDALGALKNLPFQDLGYAVVDHHRALRQGVPEVIFSEGKTAEQVIGIARAIARTGQNVLMTRIDPVVRRRTACATRRSAPSRTTRSRSSRSPPTAAIA